MPVKAKICGINSAEALNAAVAGGADAVGFVFFPPSPRALTIDPAAELAAAVPQGVMRVGLVVDMDDAGLTEIAENIPLDLLQLHGAETPERAGEIKERTGLPVMMAIKIAAESDIESAEPYMGIVDRILFDAKPPADMKGALPGGNALSFDWGWLAGRHLTYPWMLSGGLDAENIGEAVRISGADFVDVSSGVEARPGVKDPGRIAAFLECVKGL